ncbi:Response regulator of zinc sigma-54-dependent two-component system [hydrothermal vent metagenome]|uniref:Response regulator of zinc sigma-54-dependent two-component system n=1 Tax=hydrothermal vent metagenome TaxID=652676 RepID=A0A3B1BJ05_9ZZZZ
MSNKKILIVDDSPENLELLSVLAERNNWDYDTADSGVTALARIVKSHYDLVITDLMMPAMNGLELLTKIKENWPAIDVIIVTAHGSIPTAIEAIKKGAFSYLLRPFEPDEVVLMINKIFELQEIRSENTLLREELSKVLQYDIIIGKSQAMRNLYKLVDNIAPSASTVLILGESGSGKELFARALHNKSPRASQPFIKVSCAALPELLLESELFGHEKGSFTGAIQDRKGRFELADKGTLFLDEIGEISPVVQVKLLRSIQEREFERIGGNKTIKTDTRIISATNKNLAEEVKKGLFREDLYYRLNVINIEVPSLRERRDDIPLLAYHFLERHSKETNKEVNSISDEALAILTGYDWPGNVRELENVIERAVVLIQGDEIQPADLPIGMRDMESGVDIPHVMADDQNDLIPLKLAKSAWEKSFIELALSKHGGNISKTASAISIARKNLQEKIKTYKIKASKYYVKNKEGD